MKRFSSIIALLVPHLFCMSQEYHSAALYDCVGNIKEITTKSNCKFVKKKVKFDKVGRTGVSIMSYNDLGYPTGFEIIVLNKPNFEKYFWTPSNKLDSISILVNGLGISKKVGAKVLYNGEVQAGVRINVVENNDSASYNLIYSNYQYDELNNWISRTVNQELLKPNGESIKNEYVENRVIKYY